MPPFPRHIPLPFGTSLELLDPLDRDPLLTAWSPVGETEHMLAWLQMALSGDREAMEMLAERGRELGFVGDTTTIMTSIAGAVARGSISIGSARDVIQVVLPTTTHADPDDELEPADEAAWSVQCLAWGQNVAKPGESVELRARSVGVPDGVLAHLEIMGRASPSRSAIRVGEVATAIRGGAITTSWAVADPWPRAELETHAAAQRSGRAYGPPAYYFHVRVRGKTFGEDERSGLLALADDVELRFADFDPSPLAERSYRLVLADGQVREGKISLGNVLALRNISPGPVEITFERFPEEF